MTSTAPLEPNQDLKDPGIPDDGTPQRLTLNPSKLRTNLRKNKSTPRMPGMRIDHDSTTEESDAPPNSDPLENSSAPTSKGSSNLAINYASKSRSGQAMSKGSVSGKNLAQAIRRGDTKKIWSLASAGENLNVMSASGTPVHLAAFYDKSYCIGVLVAAGADINAVDNFGVSPVLSAAAHGRTAAIEELIAYGGKLDDRDPNQWTPLHWAVNYGHRDTVHRLVLAGADIHAKNREGVTPVELAKQKGYVDISDEIISLEKEPLQPIVPKDHTQEFAKEIEEMHMAIKNSQNPKVKIEGEETGVVNKGDPVISRPTDIVVVVDGGHGDSGSPEHSPSKPRTNVSLGGPLMLFRKTRSSISEDNIPVSFIHSSSFTGENFSPTRTMDRQRKILEDQELRQESALPPVTIPGSASHEGPEGFDLDRAEENVSIDNIDSDTAGFALRFATKQGRVDKMLALIRQGADIHTVDKEGHTLLLIAVLSGHAACVRALCEIGAEINAGSKKDMFTPLHTSVMLGQRAITTYLLDRGADPYLKNANGRIPLDLSKTLILTHVIEEFMNNRDTLLRNAACKSDLYQLKNILASSHCDIDAADTRGNTALYLACWNGHLDVVDLLLQHGAERDIRRSTDGTTPLFVASSANHLEVVKFLFEHGASLSIPSLRGTTALAVAEKNSHTETSAYIREKIENLSNEFYEMIVAGKLETFSDVLYLGADINYIDRTRISPLLIAAERGYLEVFFALQRERQRRENPNFINFSSYCEHDAVDGTPLIHAAWKGHVDIVKFLLDENVALNTKTKKGETVLSVATNEKIITLINDKLKSNTLHAWEKLLMQDFSSADEICQRGVNFNIPVVFNNNEYPPLLHAALMGDKDILRLLLAYGAEINTAVEISIDNVVVPATAHFLAQKYHFDKCASSLIRRGADIELTATAVRMLGSQEMEERVKQDKLRQERDLRSSAREGNVELLKTFLGLGLDLNAGDKDGNTPLFLAAWKGEAGTCRLLCSEPSCQVNFARAIDGMTPLYIAVKQGNVKVIEVLLSFGADKTIKSSAGWSPLAMAKKLGNADVISLLK